MRPHLEHELDMGQRVALDRFDRGELGNERLRRRHCWVVGPGSSPGPWPGLVVEWRQSTDRQWHARVVYLAALEFGEMLADGASVNGGRQYMTVERCVPAAMLRPAPAPPRRDGPDY